MNNQETLIEAHAWIKRIKASKKLSYTVLGNYIGYTEAGISKALKKTTLSYEQIEIIAKKLNLQKEFISNFSNKNKLTALIKEYEANNQLGVYLNKVHEQKLKSDPTYEMFIEKLVAEKAMEKLKELLANK